MPLYRKSFPNKQSDADHGNQDGCQLITPKRGNSSNSLDFKEVYSLYRFTKKSRLYQDAVLNISISRTFFYGSCRYGRVRQQVRHQVNFFKKQCSGVSKFNFSIGLLLMYFPACCRFRHSGLTCNARLAPFPVEAGINFLSL